MTNRNVFLTSDTHFGHANIINWTRKEFATLEDMEETLIDRWNAVVKPNDLVYHLGDFAWSLQRAKEVRPRLNGTIRLALGNHDDHNKLAQTGLFQRIKLWYFFEDEGFTACHIPQMASMLRTGPWNVHGHTHGDTTGVLPHHWDVSVETTGYKPLALEDLRVSLKANDWRVT